MISRDGCAHKSSHLKTESWNIIACICIGRKGHSLLQKCSCVHHMNLISFHGSWNTLLCPISQWPSYIFQYENYTLLYFCSFYIYCLIMLHYDLMVSILFERIQFLSWIPPRLFYKNCARAYCMDVLGVMTMVKRAISALGSISHLDSEAIVSNHFY